MTHQLAVQYLASPISPSHLIGSYGLIGLIIIIFAECGILLGFFLPGDTLLFSAGIYVAINDPAVKPPSLAALLICLPLAAIAGNLVGYWIGYRAGPAVFDRPNSRIFRPDYVTKSEEFFRKHGPLTIVLARFVPIVRTVATVMAGVSRMRIAAYALYSVVGGIVWTCGVVLLGYWLGHLSFVRNTLAPKIDLILLAVIVVSMLPTAVHLVRGRRTEKP